MGLYRTGPYYAAIQTLPQITICYGFEHKQYFPLVTKFKITAKIYFLMGPYTTSPNYAGIQNLSEITVTVLHINNIFNF